MTHARTLQSFIAVHALNKLCISTLLCKLPSHETKAHGAGLQYGTNESDYHCPSFDEIRLRWHEFHPFTHYNSSNNILEGLLVDFMRIALSTCCPIVQITDERINVTNSYDMEILIRKYHDDNPTVHFPIFPTEAKNSSLTEDSLLCLILQDLQCWNSAADWILLHWLDFHSYWKIRGNWCLSAFYIRC